MINNSTHERIVTLEACRISLNVLLKLSKVVHGLWHINCWQERVRSCPWVAMASHNVRHLSVECLCALCPQISDLHKKVHLLLACAQWSLFPGSCPKSSNHLSDSLECHNPVCSTAGFMAHGCMTDSDNITIVHSYAYDSNYHPAQGGSLSIGTIISDR